MREANAEGTDMKRATLDGEREHFVGIAGTGMSALAQYRAMAGAATSGSDRSFDQGKLSEDVARLGALGVTLFKQDGSGVANAARVVASTAVEAAIPDLVAARESGLEIIHRADALAAHMAAGPSVGIAGTSGKSTVTAMVFTILEAAGRSPGLITGGDLVTLRARGVRGNAWRGSGPLIAELDESDGTLVKHAPSVGVLLNLQRDHMDMDRVLDQYRAFHEHVRDRMVVMDDHGLAPFRPGALVGGFGPDADLRGANLRELPGRVRFDVSGVTVDLPIPGRHNAENALAAITAAAALDVPVQIAADALSRYAGVKRRYERIGASRGVRVIDDFAHNPTKIAATLRAAIGEAPRVLALFQPHGFGPARFMRDELTELVPDFLRPRDHLWISEIHYAGGTARKDISSADLVADLAARGAPVSYVSDRTTWPARVALQARANDLILIMGARDPGLPVLAESVLSILGASPAGAEASAD